MIFFFTLWTLFSFGTLALHLNSSQSVAGDSPITPAFNATIVDHDGVDITSSFQIRLYQEPQNLVTTATTNLTDRQVSATRFINSCPLASQTFLSSHCNFQDSSRGSLQAFTLVCQYSPNSAWRTSGRSTISRRTGHCFPNEVCVTTTSRTTLLGRPGVVVRTAACVNQLAFRTWSRPGTLGQDPGIAQAWPGLIRMSRTRVSAIASQPDGQTPVEMDTLELEAGKAGVEVEKQSCRDCLDLGTGELPQGTDSLKAEARLLTAGAVAGVLWLAVLSG